MIGLRSETWSFLLQVSLELETKLKEVDSVKILVECADECYYKDIYETKNEIVKIKQNLVVFDNIYTNLK